MIAPRVLLTNRLVVPNDKRTVYRLRKKSLAQTGGTPSRPYCRTHTTPPPQILSQTGRDRDGRLAANNVINPEVFGFSDVNSGLKPCRPTLQ